jgi:hypothetical protein
MGSRRLNRRQGLNEGGFADGAISPFESRWGERGVPEAYDARDTPVPYLMAFRRMSKLPGK